MSNPDIASNYGMVSGAGIEKTIQDDPGGKLNILRGHSVAHYKQKIVYVHVYYYERFPR
jgi:hypothetical protein